MRCAQILAYVLLLIPVCQVIGTGSDKLKLSLGPPGAHSRTPSPHGSPTHGGKPVRLFGVDVTQAPGKVSTSGHTSHSQYAAAGHPSHSAQHTYAAHPVGVLHSHPKVKRPGNLGHLVANVRPSPYVRKKPGQTSQSDPKGKQTGSWWNKANGRPKMQNGSSPDYEARKQRRERLKQKKLQEAKELHESHPSGHHQRSLSGPGSPGTGSDAIDKRDASNPLVSRTSGSGSKPSSSSNPKGNSPTDGQKSVRLFGVDLHPSQSSAARQKPVRLFGTNVHPAKSPAHESTSHSPRQPASSVHLSQTAHDHQMHPVSGPTKRPGQLGHLVAGMKQQDSFHRRPKQTKRPTDAVQTPEEKAQNKFVGKWYNRPNSRPNLQLGQSKYYETRKRYREKQKQKKLEAQGSHDQHPSGHHQQGGRGPGSPGAGSHAVSKRRLPQSGY